MRNLSKKFFLVSIFTLLFSGTAIVLDHPGFAQKLFSLTYFLLTISTLIYIWEIRKHEV